MVVEKLANLVSVLWRLIIRRSSICWRAINHCTWIYTYQSEMFFISIQLLKVLIIWWSTPNKAAAVEGHQSLHLNLYLSKWNVFHINAIVEGSYNLVINTQQSSSCWRASITAPESILIQWNVFHINTIVKEGSYNLVINTQQNYYQNSESELLENWILGCTYVWKPELEPDSRFLAKCFF